MRIKICGITNLEDALDAIAAGAHALGFVFYENSPRYIAPAEAAKIIDQLPPLVQTVGLFVNKSFLEIDDLCDVSKVGLAQIHFEADEHTYNNLRSKHLKVIRAKSKEDILQFEDEYRLVDAYVEGYGGAGKRIALEWFDDVDCSKIILAGGLNPENLSELEGYNFYGVDVSSGVESNYGKKDKNKMNDFVNAVGDLEKKKKATN